MSWMMRHADRDLAVGGKSILFLVGEELDDDDRARKRERHRHVSRRDDRHAHGPGEREAGSLRREEDLPEPGRQRDRPIVL